MAVITKPPPSITTFLDGQRAYLVYNNKIPYTCRVNDRTSLVVFSELRYAYTISQLLEAHYNETKLWPDISKPEKLKLNKDLAIKRLKIKPIHVQSIFNLCLNLNVSACVIEDVVEEFDTLTIRSTVLDIYPSSDDFRANLENLYLE